jgi:hypothetical protein
VLEVISKTRLSGRVQLLRAGPRCAQPGSVATSSDAPEHPDRM